MAKTVFTEQIDLGTNPTHEVFAIRENISQHAAQSQFGLYHTLPKSRPVRLGTIWKDTTQERAHEWLAEAFDEKVRTYHPALSSAITALGKRTLPQVLEAAQEPADAPAEAQDTEPLDSALVRRVLAERILKHGERCEQIRGRAKTAYGPDQFANIADRLTHHLASIDVLERVWRDLFGHTPSSGDVHAAVQE